MSDQNQIKTKQNIYKAYRKWISKIHGVAKSRTQLSDWTELSLSLSVITYE